MLITASQIQWTTDVTKSLITNKERADKSSLKSMRKKQVWLAFCCLTKHFWYLCENSTFKLRVNSFWLFISTSVCLHTASWKLCNQHNYYTRIFTKCVLSHLCLIMFEFVCNLVMLYQCFCLFSQHSVNLLTGFQLTLEPLLLYKCLCLSGLHASVLFRDHPWQPVQSPTSEDCSASHSGGSCSGCHR